MNIGERIRNRRKELGLSIEDIAIALNKDRSTVYRYESNDIEKMPTTVLEPLAKVLHTTPAYLMGWEDDVSNNSETLTSIEKDLLDKYRKLNTIGKAKADEYISDLSEQPKYIFSTTDTN